LSKEDTPLDSPKPQSESGRKGKKTTIEQSREASLEVVIKK